MRSKLKKGGGEFVGFALGMIGLCILMLLIINVFQLSEATTQMDNAIELISRDVVAKESIDEARTTAQSDANKLLDGCIAIKDGSVNAQVEYAAGSVKEWKKGNYIKVFITAKVSCKMPFISRNRTVSSLVMIERDG